MSAKLSKFMISVIMCGSIITFWSQESYCHQIPQAHIHIKGKITTADGVPIAGAHLRLESAGGSRVSAPFVIGLPTDTDVIAEATESGTGGSPASYMTSATGEYTIILKFLPGETTKIQHAEINVNAVSIDRSKMVWVKGGYVISPK